MKKIVTSSKAPAPVGPYSQAVEVNNFLYCSGQIPLDPETNELVMDSIEAQTQQVMQNTSAVLAAAGLSMDHVIKTAIFITDMNDFAKINEVYAKFFSEEPPARSCVQVAALPKGVNVEIEVIAYRS